MDATGNKNKSSFRNTAGCKHKMKALRKDKYDLKKDRQNSKNSKLHGYIDCINPYLESLPDPLLLSPAKEFALKILSTAIERKHHHEVLTNSSDNPSIIPNSARF